MINQFEKSWKHFFRFSSFEKNIFLQKNESKLFGKQNTKNKEINLNFQKDVEKTSK